MGIIYKFKALFVMIVLVVAMGTIALLQSSIGAITNENEALKTCLQVEGEENKNLKVEIEKLQEEVLLKKEELERLRASHVGISRGGARSFIATAYTHTGNNTASGIYPVEGVAIATDPLVIPLGSKVYINCLTYPAINGEYTAQDTGGAVRGNIIDIFLDSFEECIAFGRRQVEVILLE